jgi:hypothetical protein
MVIGETMFKAKVKHKKEPQARVLYVDDAQHEDGDLAIDVIYKRKKYGGFLPRLKHKTFYIKQCGGK